MGDSMDFLITLDQFEGPLDLMLHLIKENKLDLFDLDMNVLATQYIEYIHAMQNMHLELASEYLSELASLIAYKSKKLLPRETVEVIEDARLGQLIQADLRHHFADFLQCARAAGEGDEHVAQFDHAGTAFRDVRHDDQFG